MPNTPTLDASVQWKIRAGAIRFEETGYRAAVEDVLSSGLAREVVGLISAGKEADVYLARLGGAPLVVKVYRLYRTVHRGGRPIKVDAMSWRAAFEFEAMRLAWKGGAPVPAPARRVENMLAMRYLGGEDGPAPRLIDVAPVDPLGFRDELLAAVGKLVATGVVHGDLSAYNVLIHEDRPVFIDFSDALRVDRIGESPWRRVEEARALLTRDLEGLAAYFRRFGVAVDVAGETERLVAGIAARAPRKRSARAPGEPPPAPEDPSAP